jgi:signal transduction histidine kinase
MDGEADHPQLRSILANLSREICRPLDSLRDGIGRFLDETDRPISDAERAQAQTMMTLCDDLGLLTRERLGEPRPRSEK